MDQHAREVAMAGGKIAAGVGPTAYGIVTLNELALIVGIVCSLVVMSHTLWKWFHEARDRNRRAGS